MFEVTSCPQIVDVGMSCSVHAGGVGNKTYEHGGRLNLRTLGMDSW